MAADQLTLDLSQQPEYSSPFIRDSDWLYALDQNPSGVYSSNQVVIDTSSLSNSNKWLDWNGSYLAVPIRIRVTANTANIGIVPQFSTCIKSGFFHFFNSCQVELNGTTVQQSTSLSNLMWNYRLLTTMSYNDLVKNGAAIGFWPDDSQSWGYASAASLSGLGFTNNLDASSVDLSAVTAGQGPVGSNQGFLRRQTWLSFDASGGSHAGASNNTDLATVFKPYVEYTPKAVGVKGECIYNMIGIVKLADICPLFKQMGLIKGLLIRLTLTLNQPTFTFTTTTTTFSAATVSFPYGGQTNPVMIASGEASNGGQQLRTAGDTFTCDARIGATPFSSALSSGVSTNTGPFGQTQVRLWVQSVILPPSEETELMSSPIRTYKYNDIYETDFNVAAGATVNQLLFNSVPRCRNLVLIPQDQTYGITSPYDSAAGTTLPMCGLTNLQVQLSGMNLFMNPVSYDYRMFLEQVQRTGLNDGLIDGLSSGLIGFNQWENNYRFYRVNLFQGNGSEDEVVKNVQVSFTSKSARALRMFCFVEFERELQLNILSSAIVSFR